MRKGDSQWRAFAKFPFYNNFVKILAHVLVSFSAFYKMSTFSKTPHQLTKETLKSALRANNIPLPRAEQKKAFYVDLYLEHLTSQNDDQEFSSDDEESSEHSPMRANKVLKLFINVFYSNILIFKDGLKYVCRIGLV